MEARKHWERVYQEKPDMQLSWSQVRSVASLALIGTLKPLPRRIIDVGGGQSTLAGELIEAGVKQMMVMDISSTAIERAKLRLGAKAGRVHWMTADILAMPELGEYDLWHDRAVFHFLTKIEDRQRYVKLASSTVVPGGHLIIATFAPTGPDQCSGLPVCRFDKESLAFEFAAAFEMISATPEKHVTPWGKSQDFTYALLQRK